MSYCLSESFSTLVESSFQPNAVTDYYVTSAHFTRHAVLMNYGPMHGPTPALGRVLNGGRGVKSMDCKYNGCGLQVRYTTTEVGQRWRDKMKRKQLGLGKMAVNSVHLIVAYGGRFISITAGEPIRPDFWWCKLKKTWFLHALDVSTNSRREAAHTAEKCIRTSLLRQCFCWLRFKNSSIQLTSSGCVLRTSTVGASRQCLQNFGIVIKTAILKVILKNKCWTILSGIVSVVRVLLNDRLSSTSKFMKSEMSTEIWAIWEQHELERILYAVQLWAYYMEWPLESSIQPM